MVIYLGKLPAKLTLQCTMCVISKDLCHSAHVPSDKGEWVHFQGKQFYLFLPPVLMGVNFLRKEFAPERSKFFPFGVDRILGRLCCLRNRSQKWFPIVKMAIKPGVPIHIIHIKDITMQSFAFSVYSRTSRAGTPMLIYHDFIELILESLGRKIP